MKIIEKKKYLDGNRELYLFGIRIFQYKIKKRDVYKQISDKLRKKGVKIGENTAISGMPIVSEGFLIEIGSNCTFSSNVSFLTHDGSISVCKNYVDDISEISKFGKIKIGNNCFVGYLATFLPGVTVGDNCVIGTGSVVTKDVPDGEVWAGNPAHKISNTEDYIKKLVRNSREVDQTKLREFVREKNKQRY